MGTWSALQGSSNPALFIKFSIEKSGYNIQVTDLSGVWSQALSRRDIIKQALNDGCSIDPTEGDDQYSILLEKLQAALSQDTNTRLSVCTGECPGDVTLHLSASLPLPLPPLRWTSTLAKQPETSVASALVMPLLSQADRLKRQMQQLIDEIATKDSVIYKITDRLETSGQDLSLVFPNVSKLKISRNKSQREQYAPHVNGLTEFNAAAWKQHQIAVDTYVDLDLSRVNSILSELPKSHEADPSLTEWWTRLPSQPDDGFRVPDSMQMDDAVPVQPMATDSTGYDNDESVLDDEFQKQGTPPHVRFNDSKLDRTNTKSTSHRQVSSTAVQSTLQHEGDETETEDEDDLDAPPRKKAKTESPEPQTKITNSDVAERPRSKLSTFGEIPKASPSPDPASLSSQTLSTGSGSEKPRGRIGAIGGKAKTSSAPNPDAEEAGLAEAVTEKPKSKARLGTIGGKSNATHYPAPKLEEEDVMRSSAPKRSQLGAIGGTKSTSNGEGSLRHHGDVAESAGNVDDSERKGRLSGKQEPEGPRETSQERADKKRDQLKKEMEAKAKAPVKKKRKF